jgi:DNA processing protein
MSYSDREACIILNMVSGVGSARLEAMVSYFGAPCRILEADEQELTRINGVGKVLAEKICSWEDTIDLEVETGLAERGGVKIITRYDNDYPELLKEIHDPPICLYVRGEIPPITPRTLAIVGSRRISTYGRTMARHLAESAAYSGWLVVSGLAYGVDAIAHQATMDAKGKTIAVLGGGLAKIQPQDHIPLAREIMENGALISEFPMEFPASRHSFPMRNRIISGLSRGVLVVEAGLKSGALITAKQALEQGKLVFSVPGQADNPQARGCNYLIKQGAKLTENFDDILEEFEFLPEAAKIREERESEEDIATEKDEESEVADNLSEEETKILKALKDKEQTVDNLIAETQLSPGKLLSLLMQMEMKKLIKQLPGRKYTA